MGSTEDMKLINLDHHHQQDSCGGSKPQLSCYKLEDRNKLIGYMCVLMVALVGSVSAGCSQALGGYIPDLELNAWRFLSQLLFTASVLCIKKVGVRIRRDAVPLVCVATVLQFTSTLMYYMGSRYLPMGTFACTFVTGMLLYSSIVTVILTRGYRLSELVSVAVCLVGITLITQPWAFNTSAYESHSICFESKADREDKFISNTSVVTTDLSPYDDLQLNQTTTENQSHVGWLYGFISVGIASVSEVTLFFVLNRKLIDIDPFAITFWLAVGCLLMSVVAMGLFETPTFPSDGICQALLFAQCSSGSIANIFATVSVFLISPLTYTLLFNSHVVFMAIAQYTILRNVLAGQRNAAEICGIIVVCIGCILDPCFKLYHHVKAEDVDKCDEKTVSKTQIQNLE